jgi:ABC-2 type transport system permease protein
VSELRQVGVLVGHELRGRWRSLLIWGLALGGLGALYVALYPTMSGFLNEYIKNAPENMRQYLGNLQGPISPEQWLELELTGAIMPIALPFLAILIGTRTIAGREERKTLDLLLSNPLPRRNLVWGAALTMGSSLALVLGLTWVLAYIAVPAADVNLPPSHLAEGLVAVWPFCLFFGTLALLLSALLRRAVFATVISAVVLVLMYIINGLSQVSKSIEPIRVVSLFYQLGHPLEGDFPWTAVLAMLACAVVFTAAAAAVFAQRDVYT